MKKKLSIVIPSYNEEKNISALIAELVNTLSTTAYDFEFIFVDDGSKDNTIQEIKTQAAMHPFVYYIELSKNFGKDYALKAGIDLAEGDAVITMDADLQHPPQMLPKMLQLWEEGYDIVYTYREEWHQSFFIKG
jgi:glycosyltransferase involved in cell wall biosynthesis